MHIAFYLVPFGLALLFIILIFVSDLIGFLKAAICNIFNLLILAIIGGLLVFISQGNVLPIDLYFGSFGKVFYNIFFFKVILFFLAILLSLYPVYIKEVLFPKVKDQIFWRMKKLGIIVYANPKYTAAREQNQYWREHVKEPVVLSDEKIAEVTANAEEPNGGFKEVNNFSEVEKGFRMISAIALFLIWGWVLVHIYAVNRVEMVDTDLAMSILYTFNLLAGIFVLVYYIYHRDRMEKDDERLKREESEDVHIMSDKQEITSKDQHPNPKELRWFQVLFGSFILSIFLHAIVASMANWSPVTIFFDLLSTFIGAIFFIYFREYRRVVYLRVISNDLMFLDLLRKMGLSMLVLIIAFNTSTWIAEQTNTLVILLGGLLSLYTAIILPTKYLLFLRGQDEEKDTKHERTYGFVMLSVLTLVIVSTVYGNDLHKLPVFEYPSPSATYTKQDSVIKERVCDSERPIFYTAYGGGLMANAWNMRLLRDIDNADHWKNIIGMSGVSGGSMGIANYALARKGCRPVDQVIDEISSSNVLSIEMAWLLGWDLIREAIPGIGIEFNMDRSRRAMTYYNHLQTKGHEHDSLYYHNTAFHSVIDTLISRFGIMNTPVFVFNSTSSISQHGVAHSYGPHPPYKNAIDIIHRCDNKQPSFLDAASTSNRFPVVSPAAHVDQKGFFLDGGYFENSALMSTMHMIKDLEEAPLVLACGKVPLILQVTNSVSSYIEKILPDDFLDSLGCSELRESYESEIGSILKGGINLERLPRLLRKRVREEGYDIKTISLPYYIQPSDIKSYFGGRINCSVEDAVMERVSRSNHQIVEALMASEKNDGDTAYLLSSWGLVSPPTSRVLSLPAIRYMDAMLRYHPDFGEGWAERLLGPGEEEAQE